MPRSHSIPSRTLIQAHESARARTTEMLRLMGSTDPDELSLARRLATLVATDLHDMETIQRHALQRPMTALPPICCHPDLGRARAHRAPGVVSREEIEEALGRGFPC